MKKKLRNTEITQLFKAEKRESAIVIVNIPLGLIKGQIINYPVLYYQDESKWQISSYLNLKCKKIGFGRLTIEKKKSLQLHPRNHLQQP